MKVKNFKTQTLAFGLAALFSFGAQAQSDVFGGLFVEPSVTYETGAGNINYPGPFSNSSGTSDGFGLGAKLGAHLNEAFFLGLDFRYGMPQFKDSSVHYSARATSANWGPVIGMQMPNIGMRLWASYVVDGELNPERSGNFDVRFRNASGYRIGTGFKVASLSLNVEYNQLKYGKTILEQLGPFASDSEFSNVNLENNGWLASVSFPLAL